jgi:hypothetical protein
MSEKYSDFHFMKRSIWPKNEGVEDLAKGKDGEGEGGRWKNG